MRRLILMIITVFLISFGMVVVVQADSLSAETIHDQRHLLTASQKKRVIECNQGWQRSRNQPEIWVYTLKKLPSSVRDDPTFGTHDEDAATSFQSFAEDELQRVARTKPISHVEGDYQTAIIQRANRLEKRVSFIIVYPIHKQLQIVMVPSDQLGTAMSDFQAWYLALGLPRKHGNGAKIITYFNRYQLFVAKHVANVKEIKAGPSWNVLTLVILAVVLIPSLIIWKLRHPGWQLSKDMPNDNGFGEGYFWGWFDHDHFGGNGWGPPWW